MIFQHSTVDIKAWQRDGYLACAGILTTEACKRVLRSLKLLQAKNDAIYTSTDWNTLPWSDFGLPPLTTHVTSEQTRSMCGGCEKPMSPPGSVFPPGWHPGSSKPPGRRFAERPGLPLKGILDARTYGIESVEQRPFKTHGFLPAAFPPAYNDYVLELACHPQMLALHAQVTIHELLVLTGEGRCQRGRQCTLPSSTSPHTPSFSECAWALVSATLCCDAFPALYSCSAARRPACASTTAF